MSLDVAVVRREVLLSLLAETNDSGIRISKVTIEGKDGTGPNFNLLRDPLLHKSPLSGRKLAAGLAIGCLCLLVALMMSQSAQHQRLAAHLRQQVVVATTEIEAVHSLEATVKSLEERGAFIGIEKRRNNPALVLDELARILPDDCWLTDFSQDGDKIEISGSAAKAGSLIPILENSPIFEDAQFSAPVIQDTKPGKERFTITLHLRDALTQ